MEDEITVIDSNLELLDQYFNMSPDKQRYEFYKNTSRIHNSIYYNSQIKETSTHIYYSFTAFKICFNKSLYKRINNKKGFTYDKKTKKVKIWFGISIEKVISTEVLKSLKLDWIVNEKLHTWLTKSIFEKCLSGKITNPTDFCKAIIKGSRIKCSPNILRKFIKETDGFSKQEFLQLAYNSIGLDHYMQNLNTVNFIPNTIRDMIKQAQILDKKIDLTWSEKRLNEEHNKWTKLIMEMEVNQLEEIGYNYSSVSLLPGMKILKSNKEIFYEGKVMGHCIYTNYCEKCNKGEYLVIHYDYKDIPVTIGIRKYNKFIQDEPSVIIDQFNGRYNNLNNNIRSELFSILESWLLNTKDEILNLFNNFATINKINIDEIENINELRIAV